MLLRAMAGGDECEIELIARRLSAKQFEPGQNQRRGAQDGARFEELAAFDGQWESFAIVVRLALVGTRLPFGGIQFHEASFRP